MPHILIVEDDTDINNSTAAYLRRQGCVCSQAFSGTEGRLLWQAGGIDRSDAAGTDFAACCPRPCHCAGADGADGGQGSCSGYRGGAADYAESYYISNPA